MLTTIIILTLLGALLIALEVFIPGMVAGICGALALIGAVTLCYRDYGTEAGHAMLLAVALLGSVGFVVWIRYVPQSFIGRKWTLYTTVKGKALPTVGAGARGEALTALRPAGTATIHGRRTDVVAESELIAPGEAIEVVKVEGATVFVRRQSGGTG